MIDGSQKESQKFTQSNSIDGELRKGPSSHGSRSSREIKSQNQSCQMGRSRSYKVIKLLLSEGNGVVAKLQGEKNQHPSLPWNLITHSEKFLCPQNSCPQFWGRKWLPQFDGRLEKCALSAKKPHAHKIPRFRGGYLGGGGADLIFMGASFFSDPWISGPLRVS